MEKKKEILVFVNTSAAATAIIISGEVPWHDEQSVKQLKSIY